MSMKIGSIHVQLDINLKQPSYRPVPGHEGRSASVQPGSQMGRVKRRGLNSLNRASAI